MMENPFSDRIAEMHERRIERERRWQLEKEVEAAVIEVMLKARAEGRNEEAAVKQAFPGVPGTVIVGAEMELMHREENAWWETLERTIDVEVLHRAIAAGGGKNDGGNG